MKIKEITHFLENRFPLGSQASFDNCGLLVGDPEQECSSALISLDCTEEVVDEAITQGHQMIISHHPILFKGLKKLNGSNYVERVIIKAIQHGIALYAIHTNLDHSIQGVNLEIARRLGVQNPAILSPQAETLHKLVVFVPKTHLKEVEQALFQAGAGRIGNYAECSFYSEGTGNFKPTGAASPFEGQLNERSSVEELRLEVLVDKYRIGAVLKALNNTHPYEEVAHEIYPIQNLNQEEGSGMIGELAEEMDALEFLKRIKQDFHCGVIRHTELVKKNVKKIAFCGGSGSFLLGQAKARGADIYITGDFKYHEFFDAEKDLIIADIGHYESEQFTSDLIKHILSEKFTNFALHLSRINTNPIKYL
ncbi:MAG: Nif3-like dinuclear metal center hexameric protein [Bacteroidetes bacterium]|nr:MAG: Nif3-like dinuclear metal center hexameric protein [Bacteroidota bacterium]